MKGMDEVGRLFNANQMIVAEVLQSAEAMKAAVAHLEPHMDKADGLNKGTIVLATVKGDVHDIGKNLVDIILSNNGYQRRQPRHQGAAGRTDQGLQRASARRDRAVGPAGEIGADDGDDGAGLEDRGRSLPDPGRRRRALGALHADQDCARVRRRRRLRQRRDGRARPRQPADGSAAARGVDRRARGADAQAPECGGPRGRKQGASGAARSRRQLRRADSRAARPQAAPAARLRPRRDFPLHQPGDALHAPSRLQEFRKGARRRRSEGAPELHARRWLPSRTRFLRGRISPRAPPIAFSRPIPTAIAP